MIYGYARVSTNGQTVAAQVSQLKAAGGEKVFREVVSGARSDRNQLRQILAHLAAGDVLMVILCHFSVPLSRTGQLPVMKENRSGSNS